MSLHRIHLAALTIVGLVSIGSAGCAQPHRVAVVDGTVVMQTGRSPEVSTFDAATGKRGSEWFHDPDGSALSVASRDVAGRSLVLSHGVSGVAVHDAASGQVLQRTFMRLHPSDRPVLSRAAYFVPAWGHEGSAWVGFDLKTGRRTLDVRCDSGAALVANDDVLLTIADGSLVGYSAEDAKERWRATTAVRQPLLVRGNRALVRLEDERLGIFVASSGALERAVEVDGEAFQEEDGELVNLAAWETSFAFVADDTLRAFDLASGQKLFEHASVDRFVPAAKLLVVADGAELRGLDAKTGETRWKLQLDSAPQSLVSHRTTVALDEAGSVVTVDAATGKRLWSSATTSPAIAAGP
jgi:outer membrane protein assembly factor BamB